MTLSMLTCCHPRWGLSGSGKYIKYYIAWLVASRLHIRLGPRQLLGARAALSLTLAELQGLDYTDLGD